MRALNSQGDFIGLTARTQYPDRSASSTSARSLCVLLALTIAPLV